MVLHFYCLPSRGCVQLSLFGPGGAGWLASSSLCTLLFPDLCVAGSMSDSVLLLLVAESSVAAAALGLLLAVRLGCTGKERENKAIKDRNVNKDQAPTIYWLAATTIDIQLSHTNLTHNLSIQ